MEKAFEPASIDVLARWIFGQLERGGSVMGIPRGNLAFPSRKMAFRLYGREVATPLGVAAGPHTQLAQNIVAAWLCGARFMELKTVQVLDAIEVSRPCIDAEEVTYNCEWSQELTLEQSFTEYLHAWVLIHALAHRLGQASPGVFFNMSVGYDLEGIKSEKVQRFITQMRHGGEALRLAIDAVARVYPPVRDLEIPDALSNHVTLSTMHGCPPAEIARIARYMLEDLGLNTWVKLNPTLLGPETLRSILNDRLGFEGSVPDSAFDHDPKFEDAVTMIEGLLKTAESLPVSFGLKLSNTLEVENHRTVFPPKEKMMYLSGHLLHPLTLTLASRLASRLEGRVSLSFCGGADSQNFAALVADGLTPITVCTDLLKPGGYGRLAQYLTRLEAAMTQAGADSLSAYIAAEAGQEGEGAELPHSREARANLERHAAEVLKDGRYGRKEMPLHPKGRARLDTFDCVAAPCQEACPTRQNVPEYMRQVAAGKPTEALEVILEHNCLPAVTGAVCDRPCVASCIRNHYDIPVKIREVKRYAELHGRPRKREPGPPVGAKVAVIGGGPVGLSAAYTLRLLGIDVTVFEARAEQGGMVTGAIPSFRLRAQASQRDLARVQALGVDVQSGVSIGESITFEELRAQDWSAIVVAVGAQRGRALRIPGETAQGVQDALAFLSNVREGKAQELGHRVLVVGGGNSAMDAARTARRLVPNGEVTLVYRRTRSQMPADAAEVHEALLEGVALRELLSPIEVVVGEGRAIGLKCQRMKLGKRDRSGRPRPEVIPGADEVLPCDSVIVAISQEPVLTFLEQSGIVRTEDGLLGVDPSTGETSLANVYAGGDVVRGPASIISAVADGRKIARSIGARLGVVLSERPPAVVDGIGEQAQLSRRAEVELTDAPSSVVGAHSLSFEELEPPLTSETARAEAARCLDCDLICSLCVGVCPNRAMLSYHGEVGERRLQELEWRSGVWRSVGEKRLHVAQRLQIFNVADFCNECGNCVTFCPTSGAPWRDKPRVHLGDEAFSSCEGDGYLLSRVGERFELVARLNGLQHRLKSENGGLEYSGQGVVMAIEETGWRVKTAEGVCEEGRRIDPGPCLRLLELLDMAPEVPGVG